MASWAFWMLGRRDMAVRSLIVSHIPKTWIAFLLTRQQSPIESLLAPTPASPGSPGRVTLQAKSYLSNDPALVVLYQQLREKTLQTLKGASQVRPREEWEFVLRNARLYDRMGCDLLALDLVRHWEFLGGPPTPRTLQTQPVLDFHDGAVDYRKLLRRRSSLVVADLPVRLTEAKVADAKDSSTVEDSDKQAKPKPPPTMFHEPDANSLLDSFGF